MNRRDFMKIGAVATLAAPISLSVNQKFKYQIFLKRDFLSIPAMYLHPVVVSLRGKPHKNLRDWVSERDTYHKGNFLVVNSNTLPIRVSYMAERIVSNGAVIKDTQGNFT